MTTNVSDNVTCGTTTTGVGTPTREGLPLSVTTGTGCDVIIREAGPAACVLSFIVATSLTELLVVMQLYVDPAFAPDAVSYQ